MHTSTMRAPTASAAGLKSKRCAVPFGQGKPPRCPRAAAALVRCQAGAQDLAALDRRGVLTAGAALAASLALQGRVPASANTILSNEWEKVELPIDPGVVLLDIGFTGTDPNHGFLLGSRQTLLETFDGGKTWAARDVAAAKDEGFNYRFSGIDFNGDEGWIIGKPAILLHTTDGGKNWERVPLSAKLPGNPMSIYALDGKPGQAELTTDQGALYVTDNGAYSWTAAVQETVDATLNRTVSSGISGASYYEGSFSQVSRAPNGSYVAVSSRGNFYLTWEPGQAYWQPHNRPGPRRIQNMGWTGDNELWVSTRGGDVLVSPTPGVSETFDNVKVPSRGFGILDVGFLNKSVGFACGGSGSLFKTENGGRSWKRAKETDNGVAGNLYAIKFGREGSGFVLGNDAILLRYISDRPM